MKPLALGCLGFLVLPILFLVGVSAAMNLTHVAIATPKTTLAAPTQVGSWSAKGDLTTEPFTLQGSSARVDVTVDKQVCVYLTKRDGTHVRAECIQTSGPTYFYAGPGTYYLKMNAVGAWSATVTDLP